MDALTKEKFLELHAKWAKEMAEDKAYEEEQALLTGKQKSGKPAEKPADKAARLIKAFEKEFLRARGSESGTRFRYNNGFISTGGRYSSKYRVDVFEERMLLPLITEPDFNDPVDGHLVQEYKQATANYLRDKAKLDADERVARAIRDELHAMGYADIIPADETSPINHPVLNQISNHY